MLLREKGKNGRDLHSIEQRVQECKGKAEQGRRINNSKTIWKDHHGNLLCCKLPLKKTS